MGWKHPSRWMGCQARSDGCRHRNEGRSSIAPVIIRARYFVSSVRKRTHSAVPFALSFSTADGRGPTGFVVRSAERLSTTSSSYAVALMRSSSTATLQSVESTASAFQNGYDCPFPGGGLAIHLTEFGEYATAHGSAQESLLTGGEDKRYAYA